MNPLFRVHCTLYVINPSNLPSGLIPSIAFSSAHTPVTFSLMCLVLIFPKNSKLTCPLGISTWMLLGISSWTCENANPWYSHKVLPLTVFHDPVNRSFIRPIMQAMKLTAIPTPVAYTPNPICWQLTMAPLSKHMLLPTQMQITSLL